MVICPNFVISLRPPLIKNPNINSQWTLYQGMANATPVFSKTFVGARLLLILTCAWGHCHLERSQWCPSFSFFRDCKTLSCKMPWYFDESIMFYVLEFPCTWGGKTPLKHFEIYTMTLFYGRQGVLSLQMLCSSLSKFMADLLLLKISNFVSSIHITMLKYFCDLTRLLWAYSIHFYLCFCGIVACILENWPRAQCHAMWTLLYEWKPLFLLPAMAQHILL